MLDEKEFLCGDWVWDPVARELSHYPRRRKGHAGAPDAVEQLPPVKRVTLYRWSQRPMQTQPGGAASSGQLARVEVRYEDGRKLDINEPDRECAEKVARTIAESSDAEVVFEGAPGGRRRGNVPAHGESGHLHYKGPDVEVVLDEFAGELVVTRHKAFGRRQRRVIRTADVRRLVLSHDVKGATESFTVLAVVGPDEERIPLAAHSGYEGWTDPEEWREFGAGLARTLGVAFDASG